MHTTQLLPVFLLASVFLLLLTDAQGLLFGLPLLAGAGILGPLKIAVLAKAGFSLGVIGTALGGTALGIAIKAKDDYDYDIGYSYPTYSYGYGYRKKRSDGTEFDVEDALDNVFKSDPTHCTERMICELAGKAGNEPQNLQQDEYAILALVGGDTNVYGIHKAHSEYKGALKHGLKGSNCRSVYSSCPFSGIDLMNFIRIYDQDIKQESDENLIKFIQA